MGMWGGTDAGDCGARLGLAPFFGRERRAALVPRFALSWLCLRAFRPQSDSRYKRNLASLTESKMVDAKRILDDECASTRL